MAGLRASNAFDLKRPSASGRPPPAERLLRRRRPTPGAKRLRRPISNRRIRRMSGASKRFPDVPWFPTLLARFSLHS